jgi:hypothetical protein
MDERVFSVLGIPNRSGYAPRLAPWVFPVVTIPLSEVEGGGVEGAGEHPAFIASATVGAVAGQNSFARLLNPAASGVIVLVDNVSMSGAAFDFWDLRTGGAAGALAAVAPFPKSGGGAPGCAAQFFTGQAAAVGGILRLQWRSTSGNPNGEFRDPIQLRPGDDLSLVKGTVNTDMQGTFQFREVPL